MTKKVTHALWYWLYGVPYCPGCVAGRTIETKYFHCMSKEEAARAVREAVEKGTRCHCCGRAAR
jgi:hypothetical protein